MGDISLVYSSYLYLSIEVGECGLFIFHFHATAINIVYGCVCVYVYVYVCHKRVVGVSVSGCCG